MKTTTECTFNVNGQSYQVQLGGDESLLEVLRALGFTSLKDGCAPQGQCGCCLAQVDGRALTTCAIAASKAAGKEILTLEGVSSLHREIYAQAFAETAGLQCGFCIPGIVARTEHLLSKTPEPSKDEIIKALDGHLCRCTGYVKIIEAIQLAARNRAAGTPAAAIPLTEGKVGESLERYQARPTALGDRDYVDDMKLDGMLEATVVLSPHPRAKVLSIDISQAAALEGVVKVATYKDVPGQRYYGLLYPDWPCLVAEGEEVRYVGDVVAVVAAVDRATARKAAELVVVEYEVLPAVLSADQALETDAPCVNPRGPYSKGGSNVLSKSVIERGQAEVELEKSAHVVEGVWQTQRIEHMFLEPESCVAAPWPLESAKDWNPSNGCLKLWTQGQGVFDDRRQSASLLGIAEERIEVELVPNGGAFGGKEDMSVQGQAALMAFLTGRPVKLTLSREQSIRMHPKRHPIRMHYRLGCDASGKLTALKAEIQGDSGAYASVGGKVLERAAGHACGPYCVPSVSIHATAAYTNNPPCGAMRGFGVNQTAFAMESCLELLAEKAGIDSWDFRRLNAVKAGDLLTTGQVVTSDVGIVETLVAMEPHYRKAKAEGKVVGLACGLKNTGIGNGVTEWGKARLRVDSPDNIGLYIGYTEMGQGLLTIASQFAAEASGLPARLFHPKVDSTFALGCGQTTGSRATFFVGKAVLSAAAKLRIALETNSLEQLVGQVFAADEVVDDTTPLNDSSGRPIKTHSAYSYATQMCILDAEGKVEKLVAVHDVGRVVNPKLCVGQLEGSLHMGLGYALTEDLSCVNGMPFSFKLRDIGVLRAKDMPEVEVILVEVPSLEGPSGVKGVGEIGLVPTAAAVANALKNFDGETRFQLPMKDSPAGRAMSVGKKR
jgi:selenium-dependent xanthine dehydrogenase